MLRGIFPGFQGYSEFITSVIDKIAIVEAGGDEIIYQLGLMDGIKFPDCLKLQNDSFFLKDIRSEIADLFSLIPYGYHRLLFGIYTAAA